MAAAAVVFEELGPGPGSGTARRLAPRRRGGGRAPRTARSWSGRRLAGPPGGPGPVVVEHLGSLGVLVVVDDDGLAVVEPVHARRLAVDRSLDPLTPMWIVERPAGGRAARWARGVGAVAA